MTATACLRFILVLEVQLAGPKLSIQRQFVAMIMVCVASALGNQWYHIVPVGGWEKPTALLGCAFDLTGFCMEKLHNSFWVCKGFTLICSDIVRICFHYVPAGQLQVSEIKKGN